jgi:hypothetical protein
LRRIGLGEHQACFQDRRAMGDLLGNAVRFGVANDVLAAGEGIETMLSLRCVLPTLPMVAALLANHLAAILLPLTLRRLYLVRDMDLADDAAVTSLTERAEAVGIETLRLSPRLGDFNEVLRTFGSRHRTSSASCSGRPPRRGDPRRFDVPMAGQARPIPPKRVAPLAF